MSIVSAALTYQTFPPIFESMPCYRNIQVQIYIYMNYNKVDSKWLATNLLQIIF